MPIGTLARLPKAARMWEDVYQSALKRGYSESRSARQAWGAVKQAGYYQDATGTWRAPSRAGGRKSSTSERRLLNAALRRAT